MTTDSAALPLFPEKPTKGRDLYRTAIGRLFRRRSALVGMGILFVLVIMAIFAPLIAPYDPEEVLIVVEDVKRRQAPCIQYMAETGVVGGQRKPDAVQYRYIQFESFA